MLFNSLEFLIFLPTVLFLYYFLAPRFRWVLLLLASYYFYMCWKPEYVLLIVLSTLIDYYAALQMGQSQRQYVRKRWLMLSLVSNLGILFGFKYANFFKGGYIDNDLTQRPLWFRWSIYYLLLFAILILGEFGAKEFIYFQF